MDPHEWCNVCGAVADGARAMRCGWDTSFSKARSMNMRRSLGESLRTLRQYFGKNSIALESPHVQFSEQVPVNRIESAVWAVEIGNNPP